MNNLIKYYSHWHYLSNAFNSVKPVYNKHAQIHYVFIINKFQYVTIILSEIYLFICRQRYLLYTGVY